MWKNWRSSWFPPRTELFPFCGADRWQSSSSFPSWFWWRSSWFTPRTEFFSVFMEQIIVSLQQLPSRTLTFQLRVVRLKIFTKIPPPPSPQMSLQILLETANQGVFSTFPRRKKCEDPAHPGVGTGRGLQLMASVSIAGGLPVESGTDGSTGFLGYNMG